MSLHCLRHPANDIFVFDADVQSLDQELRLSYIGGQMIHRLEESEIDGAISEDTQNNEDGEDTLKVDALTVR